MKIEGDFKPLYISVFYLFIYYFAVTMLFIDNIRWSISILVILYIVIHFIAYFIFILILSRHNEWIIINGIFSQSISTKKKYRMKFIYSTEIFKDIIGMLTKIAKSDGVVSTNEATFISSVIDNFMVIYGADNSNKDDIKRLRLDLINHYKNTKDNSKKIESYAYSLAHHSHFQRVKVLQELIYMAEIDGFTEIKENMIYKIGYIFRFDRSQILRYITGIPEEEEYINNDTDFLTNAYTTLGVNRDDDFTTVKKKYRDLVKAYHPDTIDNKEFISQAKEKMQKLNDAYSAIKKEKSW
ncbi:DnaJ-like protein DjlA [hydrothermal vent metagenome]|uniref:DnaJ-like protein DjlA n=1 Tax=hydrothermal vent metagenome TaxID=652676 RepID=A0A1W1BTD3_9ZZZZ